MLCNALLIDCQRTKKVKQINAIKYASANYSLITAFKMEIASNDFLQKAIAPVFCTHAVVRVIT